MYIYIAAVMLALIALMVVSAYRMKPHVTESRTDDAATDESDTSDVATEENDGGSAE